VTRFVDAHVHPPVREFLEGPLAPFLEGLREYLGVDIEVQSIEEIAEFYRSRDAKAVLLGWNSVSKSGRRALGNTEIAALAAYAPDVFWGFGAVDPAGGAASVAGVHQAARLGLSGLSFHPAAERVAPSLRDGRHLWETAAEHGLVCLIHCGFTRLGANLPGGGGVQLDPARPMHVDRIAGAHPTLKVILAHTGQLWLDEAIAVALHKRNVHLCLSGISPKAMNSDLLDSIRGPLRRRVHFGSDYPFGTPDGWIAEWEALGLPAELTQAVLVDNVTALLEDA
jgi:predicted TIM-barrel fold metal-dependent hydrolase